MRHRRRAPPDGRVARPRGRAGTRKIAPALARSAFWESGSAQPSERATAAPNASAERINVPTLPGSESCQRARHVSRAPSGRSRPAEDADRAGGCGSVETPASSSASTFSPATSSSTGSIPAASAASQRSSPSQAKRPVSSRSFFRCSARTSLSFGLSFELITLVEPVEPVAVEVDECHEPRRAPARPAARAPMRHRSSVSLLLPAARGNPGERPPVRSGQLERVAQLVVALLREIARSTRSGRRP